jgi:hypothetical protein
MSLHSLGSYAIRAYRKLPESDPIMLDLVQSCVASLTIPPNLELSASDWRAKEHVKVQALFTLSSVPGALDMYWKGMRLLLSSAVPELSPSISPVSSLFWNSGYDDCCWKSITAEDVDNVLEVAIQFTDGGAELSERKTLFRKKEDKKKKKKGPEPVELSAVEVDNALLKLECLGEVRECLRFR